MTTQPPRLNARGVQLDLESLPSATIGQLRELWRKHCGRRPPPAQKRVLIRELAWHVQARQLGGLDSPTRRLLRQAVRQADRASARADPAATNAPTDEPPTPIAIPGAAKPRRRVVRENAPKLPSSTRLIRMWRNERHEVDVLPDGRFRYRGKTFRTLSEIARTITGTRWSGPRVFGIISRRGVNAEEKGR